MFPSSTRFREHFDALRAGQPLPAPAVHLHKYTPAAEFGPQLATVR